MNKRESAKLWQQNNLDKCRAYSKKWRDNNPEKHNESVRNWRRQHSLWVDGKHVRVNKRPRPDTCEVCGIKVNRLDYHHWDDNHLWLGLWLCLSCHKMAERIDDGLHIIYLQEKHGMVTVTPSVH